MTSEQTLTPALARVLEAARAVRAAELTAEQAIRDAYADGDGETPSQIARTLGVKNRQRIYAIVGKGRDGTDPAEPALTPVAYVRGADLKQAAWDRLVPALHARGFSVVRDRTTAWHLARGGVPVVFIDVSLSPELGTQMVVGRVRARYETTVTHQTIASLVTTREAAALIREHPDIAHRVVETTEQETDLPVVAGGRHERPLVGGLLDEHTVAQIAVSCLA